jgi:hypothetical protein
MSKPLGKSPVGATLALVALASCGAPAPRARPVVMTVEDLARAAATRPDEPLFPDSGVPGGLPLADYVTKVGDTVALTLRETWTHGYRSGYVTTELWSGFDEVWVQPMFVPITGFSAAGPAVVKDGDDVWHPIFSVGPDSAFYSPYWEMVYFQVPAGTRFDAYKSARDVLDAGLPLFPRRGKPIAIVPKPVVLPAEVASDPMVPVSDRKIGTPKQGFGYLDGEEVATVEFDAQTFTWNDERVVDEIPLFVLLWRRPDGALERLDVPTVAGTGPLYENRPVDVSDETHPRYGAYWRVYTVELPPSARVFVPPKHAAFVSLPAMMPPATYGDELSAEMDLRFLDPWLGRVALNGAAADGYPHGCFGKYEWLTGDDAEYACQWLDSQPAIEQALSPLAIKKTELVVTCPFVSYHDKAVAF